MKRTKYIFISGGVISGIGKGITSASIALLLQSAGYRVAPMKFEGYLNFDAGTINPIEHGDTFLCEDGAETDMDIGTYEKFLGKDLGKLNFVTMGQIYSEIIAKERRFEYGGEDVEAIHISEEIIRRIKLLGEKSDAEIVFIELGGTAGEYWNVFFYEASRILSYQNPGDVIHIHVSYVPTPSHLGEPKTKPTQLSVRTLNALGIVPDFIIARADRLLDERRLERIAIMCSIAPGRVISNPDVKSVYEIPLILEKQNLTSKILEALKLPVKKADTKDWQKFVKSIEVNQKSAFILGIVGKYFGTGEYNLRDSYAALFDAIDHASYFSQIKVETKWISAQEIEKNGTQELEGIDGLIVPIGWGERGAEGMIKSIEWSISKKIPYLGLCYGMQLAVVAFARLKLGWKDANTEENDNKTTHNVIHIISSQKDLLKNRSYGGTMRLGSWEALVKLKSLASSLYQKFGKEKNIEKIAGEEYLLTSERHRHRFEFNDEFAPMLESAGLIISARSKVENLVEIVELDKKDHPFFLATQGHPEYKSRPNHPHPFFVGLLEAMREYAK